MTTLSLLSLLLGGGLLVLSHRMESDPHAHDPIIGALSPLSVTRAACACLVAFGTMGLMLGFGIPQAEGRASRLAAAAGIAAAMLVLLLTPRVPVVVPAVSPEAPTDDASEDEEEIVGMTGTFVAPQSARALGRVVIRRGERTVALAARPVVGVAAPERWHSVVIVDIYHGTALVAPVERDGPPG